MNNINKQIQELQEFLDFVNQRDKKLWSKYLRWFDLTNSSEISAK